MASIASPQMLAVAAGLFALVCALACAIAAAMLVGRGRGGLSGAAFSPTQRPLAPTSTALSRTVAPAAPSMPTHLVMAPPPPPTIIVQLPPQPQLPIVGHAPPYAEGTTLTGNYPGLSRVIGDWMLDESDPIERVRMANDLGTLGDGDAARALLDGVRVGRISPTVAADQLERGGFAAGAIVASAAASERDERVGPFARHVLARALGTTANRTHPTDTSDHPNRT